MCDVCGCGDTKIVAVDVHEDMMASNDRIAGHNREHMKRHGQIAVNLMGAPGAGKTAILEALAREGGCRIAAGNTISFIVGSLSAFLTSGRLMLTTAMSVSPSLS